MMPRDTNGQGTIFGGVLLSYIDQAAAVVAQRQSVQRVVTVALEKVEFKHPVLVGDLVSFYGTLQRRGRTSITVHVRVMAERMGGAHRTEVTEATLVFVSVDAAGRPTPLDGPSEPAAASPA